MVVIYKLEVIPTVTMMKYLTIIVFLIASLNTIGQDCFEGELSINKIDSRTKNLEFVVFFENDTLKKICWWKKDTFKAEIYNKKTIIRTQIIKEQPIEYYSNEMTFRGHALRNDIFVDGVRIEFYTLCE